jgi:hypothetical protein
LLDSEGKESAVVAQLRTVVITICCLVQPVSAADPAKPQTIQAFISPECKNEFYAPEFLRLGVTGKEMETKTMLKPDYAAWDSTRAKPLAFKDPRTLISFYVESDGRHLAAIDPNGTLLWVRNPYEDVPAFCPRGTARPVIGDIEVVEITPAYAITLKRRGANLSHQFITITFDSQQFGLVDESTGDFLPEGEN